MCQNIMGEKKICALFYRELHTYKESKYHNKDRLFSYGIKRGGGGGEAVAIKKKKKIFFGIFFLFKRKNSDRH